MTRYVLLMRHGKHEPVGASGTLRRKLSGDGEKETREVAGRLAEVLREFKEDDNDLLISIGTIYRAKADEVVSTADLVVQVLGKSLQCLPEHHPDLDPACFKAYRNTDKHVRFVESLKQKLHPSPGFNAILIVGHQPFLGWISFELTGKALPISHSELLCLALEDKVFNKSKRGHLIWAVSPSDDQAIKDLKEKIKSRWIRQSF